MKMNMSECIGFLAMLAKSKAPVVPCNNKVVELLSSEDCVVDGVQLKRSKYVSDDADSRFRGFKFADFSLSNLQAAGVDLRMQFCPASNFAAVDALERAAFGINEYSEAIKSAVSVNVESSKND